jgi:Tfp pilus assembly protein PilF/photosystem II stability/assembly factor-like uncharacterized protein
MPPKPDFTVDPSGNVQDVRGQNSTQKTQSSAQRPEPGSSTPGKIRHTGFAQGTPGGIIFIPIGLIITLIIAVLRTLGGPAQKNSFPESDINSLNLGLSYYDQGDYEKALLHFNMVIASQPDMGEAYNDRGLTYYAMDETDKAIADINKAIELLPNPAISYSNRGGIYLFQGNHTQALADLDKAIELSPRLAKAYHNRGLTYLDLGNYDQAIADFDQAIELTPELMFSMQATMESRMPTGESLLGSSFYTGLMNRETYADLPTAYASRAMAYLEKGENERATGDLKKATQLGLDPGFAQQVEALLSVSKREPQPVSMLVPQTGHWEGNSNHGGYQGTVAFDISADGQIHDFTLDLIFGTGNSCQVASYDVLLQPDGTFSFTFGTPGNMGGNLIQGEFESSTFVAGSFSKHIECISTTGEQINGELSQGASWSAQWISGPEETLMENNNFVQPGSTAISHEPKGANITALAIDPVMPSTLYAGTSGGVFKSTDSGDQWLAINAGLTGSQVNVLVIDPLAPETLYAGKSDGLYKTTDGGKNWEGITSGPMYPEILTLVLDSGAPATIYVGTLAGAYKSTDNGKTWIPLRSELAVRPVNTLAIDPLTHTTLYAGTPDGLFKTTDGGGNWYEVNNGLPDSYIQVLAVDPVTPDTLYAGTGEGLFKSSDSGESWDRSAWSLPILAFTLDPRIPSTVFIARPDGISTSKDGGANWIVIYGIQMEIQVNVLAVDPLSSGSFYAGTSNGIFRISDGGRNWHALSIGLSN